MSDLSTLLDPNTTKLKQAMRGKVRLEHDGVTHAIIPAADLSMFLKYYPPSHFHVFWFAPEAYWEYLGILDHDMLSWFLVSTIAKEMT